MSSALDTAKSAASNARKKLADSRVSTMLLAVPVGLAYGSIRKRGIKLPNVGGMGQHATTGLIAAAIAYRNPGGMLGAGALAAATGGLTLAGYEYATTGGVQGDDDLPDDDEPDETVEG